MTSNMSQETEVGSEFGTSLGSSHSNKYVTGGKIIDCCTLCDHGVITLTCTVCYRETHKKCAEAFLRGTDKRIDVGLDNWKCPRCLTMTRLADPALCTRAEKEKNKKKRWYKC